MTKGTIQVLHVGVNMTFFDLKLLLLLRTIFAPTVERMYAMEAQDHDLISYILIAATDIRGLPRWLADVTSSITI
jgi:hypothetical protein